MRRILCVRVCPGTVRADPAYLHPWVSLAPQELSHSRCPAEWGDQSGEAGGLPEHAAPLLLFFVFRFVQQQLRRLQLCANSGAAGEAGRPSPCTRPSPKRLWLVPVPAVHSVGSERQTEIGGEDSG